MKKCSGCEEFKEYSYFHKNKNKKDGLNNVCKICKSLYHNGFKKEKQFESWMSWNNHGIYNKKIWDDNSPLTWAWQIDHIVPHSSFKYTSMEDQAFKDCWALSNLRPYSAKQNIIDGNRRL